MQKYKIQSDKIDSTVRKSINIIYIRINLTYICINIDYIRTNIDYIYSLIGVLRNFFDVVTIDYAKGQNRNSFLTLPYPLFVEIKKRSPGKFLSFPGERYGSLLNKNGDS